MVVYKLPMPFSLQPELKSNWEGIGVAEIMEISHNFSLCVQQPCSEMGPQNTDGNGSVSSSSQGRKSLSDSFRDRYHCTFKDVLGHCFLCNAVHLQ